MAKVKICGVTNSQDALWAVNLGADFIGLNFCPSSPRKVSVKHAKTLLSAIPPFVKTAGVFVNEPIESLEKILAQTGLRWAQLHGQETPEDVRRLKAAGYWVTKALPIGRALTPDDVAPYQDLVDYFLFDHPPTDVPGGTGQTFSYEWIKDLSFVTKPWFLAGGLSPESVADAIETTGARLVDVASGVESSPTRKDFEKMKRFIQAARSR